MKKKYLILIPIVILILDIILILTGAIKPIDEFVYKIIISFKCDVLTEILKFITFLANTKTIVVFNVILVLFILFTKKTKLLLVTISSITSGITNKLIKHIFKRPRPTGLKLISQGGYSFPSGHTMISFLFYGMIIYLLYKHKVKYYKVFITLLAILMIIVMISRIYLGVHYFSDIVGGACVGIIILSILISLYKKYNKE